MNRQQKRLLQKQGQIDADGTPTGGDRRPPRRPPAGSSGASGREDRPSFPARTVEYTREVRNELAKVAWPNRSEVVNYTIVVLVTLVIVTMLVFLLNLMYAKGVLALFGI